MLVLFSVVVWSSALGVLTPGGVQSPQEVEWSTPVSADSGSLGDLTEITNNVALSLQLLELYSYDIELAAYAYISGEYKDRLPSTNSVQQCNSNVSGIREPVHTIYGTGDDWGSFFSLFM